MSKRTKEFYKRIGAMGGRTKTDAPKGFAASGMARIAGKIGGAVGRRGPNKLSDEEKARIAREILDNET